MARRRTILLMINDPAQVSSGLQPDRHSLNKALWERAANARFYQGKVRRLIPPSSMFSVLTASAPMRGLHQQQLGAGTRSVMAAYYKRTGTPPTHSDLVLVDRWTGSGVATIVSGKNALRDDASNGLTTHADFTTYGDWTIINISGGEFDGGQPYLYKPAGGSADLADAPLGAVCFLKRASQLIAVGYGDNNRMVAASDADDITNWDFIDPETTAVELSIEDLNTPIRAGIMLGSNIACYGEDQLALVYWVGAAAGYFGRKIALDGIGAVGKLAVCGDGPLNYGVGRNGVWVTDGTTYSYIDEGVIGDYFEENVNWDQKGKILAFRNDVDHCIEFHFPMGANVENSEAWSFDPQTRGWSPVTAYQATDERRLYENCLVGTTGVVYLMDDAPTTAGALDLSTKPLLMQTPQGVPLHEGSLVDEIELIVKSASNVEFRYGVQEDMDGSYVWSTWLTVGVDISTYLPIQSSTAPMISGIFHKLEFRSTATNWSLDLQGFLLYGTHEGTKRFAS